MTTMGGLGEAADAVLELIAVKAQSTYPYGISGDPAKWREAYKIESRNFSAG